MLSGRAELVVLLLIHKVSVKRKRIQGRCIRNKYNSMTKNEHRWTQLMEQPFNFVLGKVYTLFLKLTGRSLILLRNRYEPAILKLVPVKYTNKKNVTCRRRFVTSFCTRWITLLVCLKNTGLQHLILIFEFLFAQLLYIYACIAFSFRIWLAKNTKPIVLKSTKSRENSKSDFNSVFMYSNLVMAQLVFL